MNKEDTKMETTIERELTMLTNLNFKQLVEFMTNNVVIDMHQYSELLGYKKMVDTKYQQLKLEFDDKLAVKNRLCDKLQDSFDDVCKQRDNLQESVYKLNGKITELENQIRKLKNKKHWLWS